MVLQAYQRLKAMNFRFVHEKSPIVLHNLLLTHDFCAAPTLLQNGYRGQTTYE